MNKLELGVQAAATTADAAVPKSTVTTNGDLIVATGSAAVSRLAVGASGTVLHGGTTPGYSQIVNADVSASAALDASKIAAAWTTYTPAWTTTGTAPAIGNGSITGHYLQIGKMVTCQIRLLAGSTTTFGTGTFALSLPVTGAAVVFFAVGSGYIFDSSASSLWTGVAALSSATTVGMDITGASGAFVLSATTPMTWAANDELNLSFVYQAA